MGAAPYMHESGLFDTLRRDHAISPMIHIRYWERCRACGIFLFYQLGNQICQALCQGSMAFFRQVHIVHLIKFTAKGSGIQEVAANQVTLFLIIVCQFLGFLHALFAHGGSYLAGEHTFADGRRCHDQNIRLVVAPAFRSHGLLSQSGHANGNAGCTGIETVLAVIGSQHDDQQVHCFMALQAGVDIIQCIQSFVDRIIKASGPAGQAFLDHQVFFSQLLLQQACPAFVFIEPDAAVSTITGVCKTVGAVFCAGQGGDQGTRALVNNLYGGTYTNADYTAYTWTSAENLKALELLKGMEGIKFDASLAGGDEAGEFAKGNLAMAFCWNGATHTNNLEVIGDSFEVLPMAFPSQNGTDVQLCGGIWGFGIFDNGDAAKTFVKFMADENTKASVEASGFWSTRKSVTGLYAGDALKEVYGSFMQYMGSYYNVVPGWAAQRTEWWNMLQDIGEGADIPTVVAQFEANANAHAAG